MQQFSIARLICLSFLALIPGCSVQEPLPVEPTSSDLPLSEKEIREIAREVAEEVISRAQRKAKILADEEQERRKKTADEQARLAQEATAADEEQAVLDAINRSEESYWLLVPSERMRVDQIRKRLSEIGLAKLDHEELQWAWQGDGQDCLKVELLAAAREAQGALEPDTASLDLTDSELIEFFCLDPLEQLRRLHLAKRLVAADDDIPEEVIVEFRRDPFLRKAVAEYMKGQTKSPR